MSFERAKSPRSIQSLSDLVSRQSLNNSVAVTPGDSIKLSWVDVKFSVKSESPSIFTRLFRPAKWKAWKAEGEKQMIHGSLGEIFPGEIVAIMGGCGAGKTTLLNVLAGRSEWGTPTGFVRTNDGLRDPQAWPWLVSFVEEVNLFDGKLSAREIIQFNTRIRLPSSIDRARKDHKAENILKSLGLVEVANKPADLLSEGQKRLLSIGIELAGERRLIFLDEPTTGLDSRSAVKLVKILRDLAKQYQLSILMSIHQPRERILQYLDRVLLMSQGHSVYYGSQGELIGHLINSTGIRPPEHENPVMDMTCVDPVNKHVLRKSRERITSLVQCWHEIEVANNLSFPDSFHRESRSPKSSSIGYQARSLLRSSLQSSGAIPPKSIGWPVQWFEEFKVLFGRFVKKEFRSYASNLFLFSEFLGLGLFVGFTFFRLTTENFGGFQSRVGLCGLISGLTFFVISANLSYVFTTERPLITRERASKTYRSTTYFAARVASLLPFRLLCMALFSTIVYYLAGFQIDSFVNFLVYFGVCQLIMLVMFSFGLILSAFTRSVVMALLGLNIVIDFFITFGGVALQYSAISPLLRWLCYLSPIFYSNTALIQNEVIGLAIAGEPGEYYIDLYDLGTINIMWAASALMIMFVGFQLIAFFFVERYTRTMFIVI